MKKSQLKPILYNILTVTAVFIFFYAIFWCLGPYNFVYQEHLGTLFYENTQLMDLLNRPGGGCNVAAAFLIQFFVNAQAGMIITAALLTVLTLLIMRLLRVIYGNNTLAPLALLVPVTMTVLHYNLNYMYSGTLAMVAMVAVLNIMFRNNGSVRFASTTMRMIFSAVATVVIYSTCGAIAFLYVMAVVVIAIFKAPRRFAFYLLLPVVVFALGYISVRAGEVRDATHALLPDGYFTHRLPASNYIYTPWYTFMGVILGTCLMSLYAVRTLWFKRVLQGIFCLAAVVTASVLSKTVVPEKEDFKMLNCMLRQQQWDDIINYSSGKKLNLLNQNCLNVALAERGMLADSLFRQPCIDIRNIYITGESTPYMNMLLSDIYYSMGHIALARRHAFEANEALDNNSPRMLQRLVDTNIAFGDYKVAEKYISRLEHTLYYRDWAKGRRALLNDAAVAADPEMSAKRACIFPDNRFSAIKGLDDDLLQIIRANPRHSATTQYLGSLYLLSHDVPKFINVIDEFKGTEALPEPLPMVFQEGIVAAAPGNDSIFAAYGVDESVLQRYANFKASPQTNRDNLWYFLRFIK